MSRPLAVQQRSSCGTVATGLAAFLGVLVLSGTPAAARAFSGGVSFNGCTGCHGVGNHSVALSMTPMGVMPGEAATVRIEVRGSASVAGLYAAVSDGLVEPLSSGGLQRAEGGVTHVRPRTVSGGSAVFEMRWTAPTTPGAVRFDVSSVMGNGNGSSGGDRAVDEAIFDFVYGCEPATFYRDSDADGHGDASLPRVFCASSTPEGYASPADDCNDFDPGVYEGAPDVCNGRDDDCDSQVDEGATPLVHYRDADGDGYYGAAERESGETFFGCGATTGRWASVGGDCAPGDATRNPGAEETCNGFDDDCDARVDERVRPRCGQGWCRRESFSCSIDDCVEGSPREEVCNGFDDDCDVSVDEGAACPAGEVCGAAGECAPGLPEPGDAGVPPDAGSPFRPELDGGTSSPTPPRGGGCAVATAPGSSLWLGVALLIALSRRRRRSASGDLARVGDSDDAP